VPAHRIYPRVSVRSLCLLAILLPVSALWSATHSGVPAASTRVSAFPIPGTMTALPGSQIALRGIPTARFGQITVTGSRTGSHIGQIAADSDGRGGSFLPDQPFAPGETVTVSTGLDVLGAVGGTFHFTIARPTGRILPRTLPMTAAGASGVERFRSRPDLRPASVVLTRNRAPSLGDVFVAPQFGPDQNGPMLFDRSGDLVWFHPVPRNMLATDFRVQRLGGHPVLTWWQGSENNGSGRGEDVIVDRSYSQIATVRAANGLQGADLHEFLLTPQGQAYITVVSPVHWPRVHKPLMDSVVQEIDIKTGLVLFEWHALDHVPLSQSFFSASRGGHIYDPFHINSIALDRDGDPIISLRNTSAAYKIDRQSGRIIWTLGGSHSSFRMGAGTRTAFQHDLAIQPDGTFTIFDNGAGPPKRHPQSRVIRVAVNTKSMRASLVRQYEHVPPLTASTEGSAQPLSRGELFVGWGQRAYFSEFDSRGRIDLDGRFRAATSSYRAYRFRWSAKPLAPPDVALRRGASGVTTVYASWNGATGVRAWRLLAGRSARSLSAVATVAKRGFETALSVHSGQPYLQVQALGSGGRVLARSRVMR
jgi:hypothetical protein